MDELLKSSFTLVGVVGIPAVVATLVALAVFRFGRELLSERLKTQIKSEYDERLETLKAQLKASGEVELERRKHELALEASRFNARYARLQEKRASVIAEVYGNLNETYIALKQFTTSAEWAGGPTRKEQSELLSEKHKSFFQSFVRQRIYFPEIIADRLDKINSDMIVAGNTYVLVVQRGGPEQTKIWKEVFEKVDGPIRDALRELERELRILMGDDPEDFGDGIPIA